jgi:hypothetical protein
LEGPLTLRTSKEKSVCFFKIAIWLKHDMLIVKYFSSYFEVHYVFAHALLEIELLYLIISSTESSFYHTISIWWTNELKGGQWTKKFSNFQWEYYCNHDIKPSDYCIFCSMKKVRDKLWKAMIWWLQS